MNRTSLKTYAPAARRAFIQAVTDRAAVFGLTADNTEPITEQGDVAIIGGKPFPRKVADKRRRLEDRIAGHGFEQIMEAVAYTWFNRLVAIRYMELHGYLDHGYRVLSHPDATATVPEIIEHAEHVTLPGLKSDEVINLKLDGGKEAQLYRKLLIAQCNALHDAMPFLFERIDDETELLLPDNLLHSDSIVRTLVASIDEEDWQEVEIIGWLYQFYISEKKDEVIGKVVKSEDIPAATQLFTPNWIVKYLVQNSLGRQWVATYPDSPLKAKMEYYIEPAEQTPEVQAKLDEITRDSLNPEELTLLDPACGSGHILVEAYDLLKEIYLERGYRLRDIPALILTKNVFGLEIDDRAAQLAAFALMMKARADDRRIFDGQHQPNVLSIQDSNGLDINDIVQAFTSKTVTDESFSTPSEFGFMTPIKAPLLAGAEAEPGPAGDDQAAADLKALLHLFENAKTYGSLITIPDGLAKRLPALAAAVEQVLVSNDMMVQRAGMVANVFVSQAAMLGGRYDAVVANPPYMGSKGMNSRLKTYAQDQYPDAKAQLFSMFLARGFMLAKMGTGHTSMITLDNWLSAASYARFRRELLSAQTINCLLHMPYEGRGTTTMGIAFGTTAASFQGTYCSGYKSHFSCARHFELDDDGCPLRFPPLNDRLGNRCINEVQEISGTPILYWASETVLNLFAHCESIGEHVESREGMATADNDRFIRFWHEVPFGHIEFECTSHEQAATSHKTWFPYVKGGDYRKWAGNTLHVVNWKNNGADIRANADPTTGRIRSHNYNGEYAFRSGITWSGLSSSKLSVRHVPIGFMFDAKGPMAFAQRECGALRAMGVLNSSLGFHLMKMLAPTLDFKLGHVMSVPCELSPEADALVCSHVSECIEISRDEWDSVETSWGFHRHYLLQAAKPLLEQSVLEWHERLTEMRSRLANTETQINSTLLGSYGMADELSAAVSDEDTTLSRPNAEEDIKRLYSYAVGCLMGRYSLDEQGLIYAYSGNDGFDPNRYKTFAADADGIVPLTEFDWFEDGAARRFEEFIAVAWPKEHLEENLAFVAENLGAKKNEHPRDTIRRYFAKGFFRDHLKTYKKRPIYWLFSSGKLGAFQALVYLHRYNEGTLARMRTEYVIPLQGKISARIDQLEGDKAKATSASHRNKIQKEQDTLRKHQDELRTFDEKLRHYADQRIALDLDDGVKVNYGKFGDLLADVTAVCGKTKGKK